MSNWYNHLASSLSIWGGDENAGLENAWKTMDQITGVENAGLES